MVQATLEPADSLGPEPFTEEFAAAPVVAVPPALEATLPAPATGGDRGEVVRVRASEPGLYGGTQDDAECDTAQLVAFLDSEPAKSTAWVEALKADDTVVFRRIGSGAHPRGRRARPRAPDRLEGRP